jgi:hypothetical protein
LPFPARILTALLAACLTAVLAACGSVPDAERSPAGDVPVIRMPARWASANARDVQTLVSSTDAVFVGQVTALSGQRDEHIRPTQDAGEGDPDKPATGRPAGFPISIYDVLVQNSIHGSLAEGSVVVLEQPGGLSTGSDGSRAIVVLEEDELLEVGGTYLFFANVDADGVVTTAPFARFVVGGDGSITPLDEWRHLATAQRLESLGLEGAVQEVKSAAR